MCLIIENKTEKKLLSLLTKEKIAYYMQINPDGFGITTFHKKFITKRGFGLDEFLKALEEIENIEGIHYFIHFRKATVGKICLDNTHPFDILGNDTLYLMHNGTLPDYENEMNSLDKDESDTKVLTKELKKILKAQKDMVKYINQEKFKSFMNKKLGTGRAVLISQEQAIMFNENLWFKMDNGLTYSKRIESEKN